MKPHTALITGAASGIGLALAQRMAQAGHPLYLTDRSEEIFKVADALSAHGTQVWAGTADLAIEADLKRVARDALDKLQGCAILVNCAGMTLKVNGGPIPLEDLDIDAWERLHRVNLVAPMVMCREIVPQMAKAGYGRVVNVASRAGRMHVPPAGLEYHASKAGLIGASRALAGIYAKHGVTVNCVAPGRVDTPMCAATNADLLAQAKAAIPAGRFASADEIAASIEFLVSPGASYITGSCLDVTGGVYMN
ncbi:SDR family oxidoreductase [Imbroritus primus]|uniref:SDR family oxidoreductase n=1 Tax=Imbroritus primus TaxID=3058603 RepID=A0ACD3SQ96_9BURK|nr:SDR family oxidoreductase [Burkholderiaceae bacterium PBA]